jgi:hypothetical protein
VRAAVVIAFVAACGSKAPPPDAQIDATPISTIDAPAPVACSAGPMSGDACTKMSDLCPIANGCCVCGGLEGLCAQLWVCATPATNDAACPATQPADVTDCSSSSVTHCDYCGTGGEPVRTECIAASGYLPCQQAGLTRCWVSSDQSAGCD